MKKYAIALALMGCLYMGGPARADHPMTYTDADVIVGVSHDASGTLSNGDVLHVTMFGEPGGRTTFDIGTEEGIAMIETSPGIYEGSIAVSPGMSINGPVSIHLYTPDGRHDMAMTSNVSMAWSGSTVYMEPESLYLVPEHESETLYLVPETYRGVYADLMGGRTPDEVYEFMPPIMEERDERGFDFAVPKGDDINEYDD